MTLVAGTNRQNPGPEAKPLPDAQGWANWKWHRSRHSGWLAVGLRSWLYPVPSQHPAPQRGSSWALVAACPDSVRIRSSPMSWTGGRRPGDKGGATRNVLALNMKFLAWRTALSRL